MNFDRKHVLSVCMCAVQSAYMAAYSNDHPPPLPSLPPSPLPPPSSDYASIDSAYQRHCVTLSCRKVLCSKGRLLVLAVSAVPLLLIAATEIALAVSTTDTAPSALVWVLFISLLVPRFGVVVMVILLVGVAKGTLKPTVLAKVVLVTAVLLSLLEEIPPSFWNVAPFTSSENCSGRSHDCHMT